MSKKNIISLIIGLLICLGSGLFLVSQIKLDKDRDRNIAAHALTPDLKGHINETCKISDTPQEIINKCSELACKRLSFTAKNDISRGKANCVGYAQQTSALINYAFLSNNMPYKAKPVVGKVFLLGIDLNNIAQKILPPKHRPFFKDHDFVEINLEDKTLFIDSSLQDLTGFTFMQIHNP